MTASTTWRLEFAASQGGQYIQLSEVYFLGAGDVDLSTGGTASASSIYGGNYDAAKAFDRNPSTDWCTASGAIPAWLQYVTATPVEVAKVRIQCASNAAWAPPSAASLRLYAGTGQETRFALQLLSGSFTGGAQVDLAVVPYVPPPIVSLPRPGHIGDRRYSSATMRGTIAVNNIVTVKPSASAPEAPYAGARVRLHHLPTGRLGWQGLSDADGYYHASGLEVGAAYYPVAIDPTGQHECDAAGPVIATLEAF